MREIKPFASGVNMSKPSKIRRSFKIIIQLLLVFIPIVVQLTEFSSLHAQTSLAGPAPGLDRTSAATYYYRASPGELTIQVNVWGYVRNPGCYEVSSSTNLLQLMAYAGGSVGNGNISDIKITRIVNKNLLLTTKDIFVHIYNSESLEKYFLPLFQGDIIYIDPTLVNRR